MHLGPSCGAEKPGLRAEGSALRGHVEASAIPAHVSCSAQPVGEIRNQTLKIFSKLKKNSSLQ